MVDDDQLKASSRRFLHAAFGVLSRQRVIPVSGFRGNLRVGYDYAGPDMMALPEFQALEAHLEAAYEGRFKDPLERTGDAEYPNSYIFSFLEAAIVRCRDIGDYSSGSAGIDSAIADLVEVLGAEENEVVCCRAVAHLTTQGKARLDSGRITVVPEPTGFHALERLILTEIPTAAAELNSVPLLWDRPHSLIIAREATPEADPVRAGIRLSAEIDRFLLQLRLLSSGTMHSAYEIRGPATAIAGSRPQLITFNAGRMQSLVSRVVELREEHLASASALGTLIADAAIKRDGLVFSSFDLAVHKFDEFSSGRDALDTLVELAIGLEASFAEESGGHEGLTLRLCTRAAALLATADDTGRNIFSDIAALYGLRSRMIHGGPLKQRKLTSVIKDISTVPPDDPPGIAIARAVDRMRDLVRRAILARVSLAAGEQPLWPFNAPDTLKVDQELADDAGRELWRRRWRDYLSGIGAEGAEEMPRAPADFFTGSRGRRLADNSERAVDPSD